MNNEMYKKAYNEEQHIFIKQEEIEEIMQLNSQLEIEVIKDYILYCEVCEMPTNRITWLIYLEENIDYGGIN